MTFPTRPEYETLIYGLPEAHPEILNSTLHLYSTSALTAIVEGQIQLKSGLASASIALTYQRSLLTVLL